MKKKSQLVAGISLISPLVIKTSNGYTGFEIELWEKISSKLNLTTKYVEYNFDELLADVENNKIKLGIAGITRTSDREKKMLFSFFTLSSSLGILILKDRKLFIRSIRDFFLKNYKKIFFALIILLTFFMLASHLLWFLETKNGTLGTSYKKDFFESVFLIISAATNSGFSSELILNTFWGKFITLLSMISGLFLFGLFTASLASMLTIAKVTYLINSYKDLNKKFVATKEHTVAREELDKIGAKIITVKEIDEAYEMLKKDKIDAVVFDSPALLHYVKNSQDENLTVVDQKFAEHTYGFAFPLNSKLREQVNIEILSLYESGEYDILHKKWFGEI
ncbi:MAG: transporter substrate-binding domain-containing protein [Sphaerochaetaceae bacterium]|nr:transporter substrate-binding domain-containing protein [Candidatus Paceibacterota bacterium]